MIFDQPTPLPLVPIQHWRSKQIQMGTPTQLTIVHEKMDETSPSLQVLSSQEVMVSMKSILPIVQLSRLMEPSSQKAMPNQSSPSLERIALSMEISPQMQEQRQSTLLMVQVEQSLEVLQKVAVEQTISL